MEVPDDRRYTRDHEWTRPDEGRLRIGITDYAQDALGDVVFVNVPDVGAAVDGGGPLGEVESTKSVSDVYAPLGGTVVAVNQVLGEAPDRVNEDPYGEGWICAIEPRDEADYWALLDAEAYRRLISS